MDSIRSSVRGPAKCMARVDPKFVSGKRKCVRVLDMYGGPRYQNTVEVQESTSTASASEYSMYSLAEQLSSELLDDVKLNSCL